MKFMIAEILGPGARRSGTAVAGYLTGMGMAQDTATQVGTAVAVVILFAADLVISNIWRKKKGVK